MKISFACLEIIEAMINIGNPNSITDAGVGALCIQTAVKGAFMNVKINAGSYNDKSYVADIITQGNKILKETNEKVILLEDLVNKAIV